MNGFERLGARIASEQDALRARRADATRARLREQIGAAEPRRKAAFGLQAGFALAGCALIAAASAWLLLVGKPLEHTPLSAQLERSSEARNASDHPLVAGTFIEADAREPLALRFSDGSRIELAPRSRARLVELDADGAHVLLESGLARVHVIHRAQTRYRLSAGPFKVLVTGTRFELRWNPEADAFELALGEGHVEVSGCSFGPGYGMSAGQRVRASCKNQRFAVSAIDAESADVAAAASVPASERAARAARQSADSAPAAEQEPARLHARAPRPTGAERADWLALAQAGKYVAAFAAAEAAGFEAQTARAGARELPLLADAARYAGATRREAYALQALRKRFAGSEAAAVAAFSLGRLEFDRHGAYQKAAQWFDTYLKEQPAGPLSREARGRLIEATVRAGDFARARALADAYVRDYPAGPHANLARSLQ